MVWRDALAAVAATSAMPLAALAVAGWHAGAVRRWAPHAAALAVGALLGGALGQLLPEAYARTTNRGAVPVLVVAGVIAFFALEWLLHGTHDHHTEPGHGPSRPDAAVARRRVLVRLAVTGDALHNLVDGALVAATFLADARAGLLTTLAVALHEVPREFGTFGAIVHGGVSPRRALAYNAGTALASGIGAVLTLTFGAQATAYAPVVLAFAAGNFLYLAGALVRSLARADAAAGGFAPRTWVGRAGLVALGAAATGLPALL